MNLANRLTLSRLFMTAFFVVSLTVNYPYHYSVSLVLFLVASLTDYLDGEIARRCGMITDFGKLMDPLADKILVMAAFVCLIPLKAIPDWAAIIIISREFLITGLRMLAATKGLVLPAEKMGKHKTVWQMVTIFFFLIAFAVSEFHRFSDSAWWKITWQYGGDGLITLTIIFTVYSGLGYLWKNRTLLKAE